MIKISYIAIGCYWILVFLLFILTMINIHVTDGKIEGRINGGEIEEAFWQYTTIPLLILTGLLPFSIFRTEISKEKNLFIKLLLIVGIILPSLVAIILGFLFMLLLYILRFPPNLW